VSVYPKERGLPVLRPSVVLVIDILGFTRRSLAADREDFVRLYRAITRAQRFLKPLSARSYELKVYTDNIVICWPIGVRTDSEFPLGVTMLQAAAFQMSLTCDGYCARGAIAIGDVFADRRTVFGPALIEAHEQEQAAKYPRIVLAPSAAAHALAHVDYYGRVEYAPQNDEILFDLKDKCAFIDYLTCWSGNFDEPSYARDALLPARLKKHKKFIEENLAAHKSRRIRAKYLWLARYHNYVVTARLSSGPRIARASSRSRFATILQLKKTLERNKAKRKP
jgi:hypothetical protein